MPNIRQVFLDNHWELQCPQCRQFVPVTVDVMTGRAPFPAHLPWTDVGEPVATHSCTYTETVNWRADMPATGVGAMGPLA